MDLAYRTYIFKQIKDVHALHEDREKAAQTSLAHFILNNQFNKLNLQYILTA